MLLLQYGNMSKDLTRYNTKLFAEQVMPKLRDCSREWDRPLVAAADGGGAARRGPGLHAEAGGRIIRRRGANVSEPETLTIEVNGFSDARLAQGQRPEARLPGRLWRPAALDSVSR